MKLNKKIIHNTNKFIKRVHMSGIPVSRAYIFGSYAKGSAKSYSDIDVCVVSRKFGKDFIDEMVQLQMLSQDIDSRIEPIPIHPKDFENPWNPLAHEVKKYGIELTKLACS